MQRTAIGFLLLGSMLVQGCGKNQKPQSENEKLSYTIGVNIGRGLMRDSIIVNEEMVARGIKDAWLDSSKRMLSDSAMRRITAQFQEDMVAKKEVAAHKRREVNTQEGNAFLDANAKRKEVVTLSSGLQYEEITRGTGPKPKADQTVSVIYRGLLTNGKEFDTSGGTPVEFPVHAVIPGWTEALQLMPVGSKWKLFVPSKLGYGSHGFGDKIGPDQTLIFEVELVGIK